MAALLAHLGCNIKTATTATFTLKSDLSEAKSRNHSSGVLHASKPSRANVNNDPQHDVFMWIEDVLFIQSAVKHFVTRGYDADNLVFIPFSSFENWFKIYPFVTPTLGCSETGKIGIYQHQPKPAPRAKPASTAATTTAAGTDVRDQKQKRGGPRLYKGANLTNDLRDELHIQMYRYFQWFLDQLTKIESTKVGRNTMKGCGFTILGIQTMLSTFESVFPVVKTALKPTNIHSDDNFPLLEQEVMEVQLGPLADRRLDISEPIAHYGQGFDFDQMFQKLVEFKEKTGTCKVTNGNHKDSRLVAWVKKIRERKIQLDKKGIEFEGPNKSGKVKGRTLTKERIEMLNELGFDWGGRNKKAVPWEERFQSMMDYFETHGTWPRGQSALGMWAWSQRKLYHARDKNFMEKRFGILDEVGFDWDPTGNITAKLMSWDDGFEKLVAFGEVNGHFNVPPSLEDDQENGRFYKWVQTLHMDYRFLRTGQDPRVRILDEDRVSSLEEIGFKFNM